MNEQRGTGDNSTMPHPSENLAATDAELNKPSTRKMNDILVPALIFYLFIAAGIISFGVFVSDKPFSDSSALGAFLFAIYFMSRDFVKAGDWRIGVMAVGWLTTIAVSAVGLYQLVMDRVDIEVIGMYPLSAILILAVMGLMDALRRIKPIRFAGQRLSQFGDSKWVQYPVIAILLGGTVAITVIAHWLQP
jgi:hypothetical protein